MFSSRLDWDSPPNPLLELLAAKRAAGIVILDLTESNPTRADLDYSGLDLAAALAQPDSAVYQPSPRGLAAAREAVAGYYRAKGRVVDPDSIFLTASTSEAYSFLFKLFCDPGDEVLVPRPGYPLFDFLTALDSVRPIDYSLNYDATRGWQINFERLRAAIGERTRAIIVVSPHNPTGHCLKQHEREQLNAFCAQHNLALIVDEVFLDYSPHSEQGWAGTLAGNTEAATFVVSGLSKIVAVPQLKLGWIQISGPERIAREAAARLEFIADTYLSVSTPAQLAAPYLLARRAYIQDQIRERIESNFRWLEELCAGLKYARVLTRESGWYVILQFDPIVAEVKTMALLEDDNVFVHPGYFFDFEDEHLIVLSLLTPETVFHAGVTSILEWKI